jgi:hypothetical protein
MRFFLIITILHTTCFATQKIERHQCTEVFAAETLRKTVKELGTQFWIDERFSLAFLNQLEAIEPRELGEDFGINPDSLVRYSSEFTHWTRGREPLAITPVISKRNSADGKHAVVLFLMRDANLPVGFLALSLQRQSDLLLAQSEYLKTDRSPSTFGVSGSFFRFTRDFYKRLGVSSETIEAGWSGRPIWAAYGYEFDEHTNFVENGVKVSQIELVRHNFLRFAAYHVLALDELYKDLGAGRREELASDLSNLRKPSDFAIIKHKKGKMINVAPYVDVDTLESFTEKHIGMAFSLWDYRPRGDQEIIILQGEKSLSDIAMPTWIGRYHFREVGR